MKLRNILITAAAVGMMFASMDRTSVVGYTEGDYADMNTFAHKAWNTNTAWTSGTNFNAVWTDGASTWGFSGGDEADLVNMRWSNDTYGLSVGLNMDSGTAAIAEVADSNNCGGAEGSGDPGACGDGVTAAAEVAGETTFDFAFGMNVMNWDVGFAMNTMEDGPMALNARGKCGFWAFDTFTVGYESAGDYTVMDFGMYGVQDWGSAKGYFGMGVTMDDNESAWHGGEMTINTSFSVESTLTDWCDLRIGYNKYFNMAAEVGGQESSDAYSAGLGFNYGSVQLDMIITDNLDDMVSNPLSFVNGRNSELATQWTLSYTW